MCWERTDVLRLPPAHPAGLVVRLCFVFVFHLFLNFFFWQAGGETREGKVSRIPGC